MIGVVGLIARDIVDEGAPRLGGGGWWCARALAALGQKAAIATKFAAGDQRLAAPLFALGLEVVTRPAAETATFVLTNRGDRRDLEIAAVGDSFTPEDARTWIAEALGSSEWVHAAALSRHDFAPETLAELAAGRLLSLDGQGLVRPGRRGPVTRDGEFDPAVLEHVQMLKLSASEAAVVDVDSLEVPEILVSLGSRGVVVRAEGREDHVGTRPLEGIDPTGAGDSFSVAYLVARTSGQAPIEAARSATAVVHGLLTKWHSR